MRVDAVVVNWNQPELTRACVQSLLEGDFLPRRIIVVDNGSEENPERFLSSFGERVNVHRLERNAGFAAGANAGIRLALEGRAEAVFLVNNDAVVAPNCLSALVAVLDADLSVAVAGAKTLTQENPPRIHTAYGVLTYHGPLVQQRGWMEEDVSLFSEPADVDYVSGCAMLLRAQALCEVGLFDERFFAYHEDLDWCVRARHAGYRVRYVPQAIVYHRMHASTGGGGYLSPITYLSARNAILFVRKNAPRRKQLKYALHLAVNLCKDAWLRYRRGELAGFRLRLLGVRDGLLQRPVPVHALGLEGKGKTGESA